MVSECGEVPSHTAGSLEQENLSLKGLATKGMNDEKTSLQCHRGFDCFEQNEAVMYRCVLLGTGCLVACSNKAKIPFFALRISTLSTVSGGSRLERISVSLTKQSAITLPLGISDLNSNKDMNSLSVFAISVNIDIQLSMRQKCWSKYIAGGYVKIQ